MKRIGMAFCVVLLVLALTASALAEEAPGSGKFEGDGFDTPEEAVEAFIEARQKSDVQSMISTFAIETFVDAFDAKAYLGHMIGYKSFTYKGVPIANEYARQVLISQRVAEISRGLFTQYMEYMWPVGRYGGFGTPVSLRSEEEIDEFLGYLTDSERASILTDLELIDFISLEEYASREEYSESTVESFYDETNQRNLAKNALDYNCDELAERIAHIRVKDMEGYLFMQCLRYGDKWYNGTCNSYTSVFVGLGPYANGYLVVGGVY